MRLAVAPLAARVTPVVGESLMSLVARAAQANVFPRLSSLLSHAGVTSHPAFTPFTAAEHVEPLAELLGVDVEEITTRMHLPTKDAPRGVVAWAGVRLERRWIEAKVRRVAPGALMDGPHHRMVWSHRALSFCPESFERLVSSCQACGRKLGWVATHGLDRCEHCRAVLLKTPPDHVPDQLHARLRAATHLISPISAVRDRAQMALPAQFLFWDAGELFTALLELGVAWEHPGEGRGSRAAQALSEPRLGLITPTHIARGVEVLQGWPDSFAELVGRIWREAKLADPNASAALRKLGLLSRHFDGPQADSDYHRLLTSHIMDAAAAGGLPVKRGSLAHLTPEAPAVEFVTLKQAQTRFKITSATLGRLDPDGESWLGGRRGRGGGARLDAARLARAAQAYHDALSPPAAGARLGVPPYCLQAFVDANLICTIEDRDALLLAGSSMMIQGASVLAIHRRLMRRRRAEPGVGVTVAEALAHQFSPTAWACTFEALAKRRLNVCDVEPGERVASKAIRVRANAVRKLVGRLGVPAIPPDTYVSADAAGLLLGVPDVFVGELIEVGLLSNGGGAGVPLRALAAFDADHMLSPEYYRRSGTPRGSSGAALGAVEPVASTRHLRVWRRAVVEEIIGGALGLE